MANLPYTPPQTPRARALAFGALAAGYLLLGLAGLQLQSSQTGITPVWPASGFAFAIAYWFGVSQVLALLPAMLGLAWIVGIPADVAVISALGSMLEAAVPVVLLRRFGVDPRLAHLRDTLLFIGLGPVLGPALSASVGTMAFAVQLGSELQPLHLWLLWWLGNSVGILIVGGFGLVATARGSLRLRKTWLLQFAVAASCVAALTALGLRQVVNVMSPLVLYLLIPVFVLAARRGEQYLVMLLAVLALAVVLLSAIWLPAENLAQRDLGILYLDISLIWVIVFTGMLTSSARREVRAREEVSWLANHDPLTRLMSRHVMMERLEAVLAGAADDGNHVLLYLDLDRFKDLNDAEGHRAGDRVLRDVSVLLANEVRSADAVARMGGDEFAVLLEDCTLLDACAIAENIRGAIERYEYSGERGHHRVEASVGLLELASRHTSPEDALHEADAACYDAKRSGRNRVCVYAEGLSGRDG
ncbi:MAG: diguanylate cyclase [Gammaproteobacteria bacterium]|nr:diguanylate cyclase [Gammaproteobacteria bacterium]